MAKFPERPSSQRSSKREVGKALRSHHFFHSTKTTWRSLNLGDKPLRRVFVGGNRDFWSNVFGEFWGGVFPWIPPPPLHSHSHFSRPPPRPTRALPQYIKNDVINARPIPILAPSIVFPTFLVIFHQGTFSRRNLPLPPIGKAV